MSIPVETLKIGGFAGSNYGANYLLLSDAYGDLANMRMTENGELRSVSGFEKMNASSLTTNTGAAASRCVNLFSYQKVAAAATVQRILGVFDTREGGSEWEIWYTSDLGVNWTFLYDAGVTPSTGAVPTGFAGDFAQFGDTVYITVPNGTSALNTPRKWDGTTFAAAGRTQSPTPSSAAGSAGVLSGNYQWKLLSVIANARQAGSVASTSLALDDEEGSLTWTADANTNVTGYELYRTTGTGSTFYFVAYIDGRTTAAYTDNTSDLTIIQNRPMQEHGDAPPQVMLLTPHKQRMWWARTIANPTRVYFSDPGLPEDVYAQNYLDFSDTDFDNPGDTINGIIGDFEGQLVVFMDHSISTVSGTGQILDGIVTDWNKVRTGAQIGTGSPRSIVKIPAGAMFVNEQGEKIRIEKPVLAYISSVGDFRIFDGEKDTVISSPINYWLSPQQGFFDSSRRFYAYACVDHGRKEVIFAVPTVIATTPRPCYMEMWAWNYEFGTWSFRSSTDPNNPMQNGIQHYAMIEQFQPANSTKWLFSGGGDTSSSGATALGNFYSWTVDYPTFDTWGITSHWTSKVLYPRDETGRPIIDATNRWRWLTAIAGIRESSAGDLSLGVSWKSGDNTQYEFEEYTGTGALTGGSSTTVTLDDAVSADNFLVKMKDSGGQNIHSTGIIVRFVAVSSTAKYWFLRGLALAYQALPGNFRGMQ